MFQCDTCGEHMEGNGYSVVFHCPNATEEDYEYLAPDEDIVYCRPIQEDKENV